jgi:hypothetical protein
MNTIIPIVSRTAVPRWSVDMRRIVVRFLDRFIA